MTMQEGDHDSRATGHRRARDAGSGELQRRTTQTRGRRRQPTSGSVSASSHGVCATFRVWPPTFGKCLTQLQPRGAGPATQHPTGGESGPTVWLSSSRALEFQLQAYMPRYFRSQGGAPAAGARHCRISDGGGSVACCMRPVSSRILASCVWKTNQKDPKFVGGATETCFNLSPILGFV